MNQSSMAANLVLIQIICEQPQIWAEKKPKRSLFLDIEHKLIGTLQNGLQFNSPNKSYQELLDSSQTHLKTPSAISVFDQ